MQTSPVASHHVQGVTVVILAVLECPDLWEGLRKVRISQHHFTNQHRASSADFTGLELQEAILSACQQSVKKSELLANEFGASLVVEAYDEVTHKFVPLRDVADGLRFGRKIRAHVVKSCDKDGSSESTVKKPLAITGRFFPYDPSGVVPFAGASLVVKEIPNNKEDGTGLNIWDGAMFLTRYLELYPEIVRSKRVLELGSGCGLVGIGAAVAGAKEVVLTDLPYTMDTLKKNVSRNMATISTTGCTRIECMTCDWFDPPQSLECFGFTDVNVILVADCVWVESLVAPLIRVLDLFVQNSPAAKVLISYQRRGVGAHEAFWNGIHSIFDVSIIDTNSRGLRKPDVLFLLECQHKQL